MDMLFLSMVGSYWGWGALHLVPTGSLHLLYPECLFLLACGEQSDLPVCVCVCVCVKSTT